MPPNATPLHVASLHHTRRITPSPQKETATATESRAESGTELEGWTQAQMSTDERGEAG
jgi:hypothetical protein